MRIDFTAEEIDDLFYALDIAWDDREQECDYHEGNPDMSADVDAWRGAQFRWMALRSKLGAAK